MQEQNEHTLTTDNTLGIAKTLDGKDAGQLVRPNSKVAIRWIDSKFHTSGTVEEVHPSLAEKLVDKGTAEYATSDSKKTKTKVTTKEEGKQS